MTRARAAAAAYLWGRDEPDVLACVFVGPDRLQHWLWHHLDPAHARHDGRESQRYLPLIQKYFAEVDRGIEEILRRAGRDALVFIVSDHGFHRAEKQLSLHDWLEERHLLELQKQPLFGALQALRSLRGRRAWALRRWYRGYVPPSVRRLAPKRVIEWRRTKAYAPWSFQEGISLNVVGREPEGTVHPDGEFETLRAQLRTALLELTDPATKEPVLREVQLRDELFSGPYIDCAADLVLVARDGYSTAPPPHPHMLFRSTGWSTGSHDREGIFIASGPGIKRGRATDTAQITDVAPTLLYLLGLPVPDDLDGRVMTDVIEASVRARLPELREPARATLEPGGADIYNEEEEADLREHLRGMGYL
jgi:predicted AlkP superfamily phosphohydrolase/phosphomutase